MRFGGCVFSNGPDNALTRHGSCASQSGKLDLHERKITFIPVGVFDDMGALE